VLQSGGSAPSSLERLSSLLPAAAIYYILYIIYYIQIRAASGSRHPGFSDFTDLGRSASGFTRARRAGLFVRRFNISCVSLVDKGRQYFKSAYGLDTRETERDVAFCGCTPPLSKPYQEVKPC